MIFKLGARLKYITFIFLLFISEGLVGCNAKWMHSNHNHYSIQKEKTSISPHHQHKKITSSTSKNSLWHQIIKDFALTHYTHQPAVKMQIKLLLQRPHQLQNTIKNSAPYINYVYEQVKKRHLPAELVFLPFIESTYDPFAFNKSSGASGLWQLTPGTAQKFGVRQDMIFDGKYDLYTATHAALDYLTYLNQLFCSNWLLTLAAYDTGEGNVKRAIDHNKKRHRSTHFWDLPLSLETTSYVPKLLAISAIVKNPKKYGIALPVVSKKVYLESIEVKAGISIIHAAALADIRVKELIRFNPGFKKIAFIPKHPYKLLLPAAYIGTFKKNLAKASQRKLNLKLFYYTVKPGDTLNQVAKKHRVTIEQLCLWNGLKPKQVLPIHKKLLIIKKPVPHKVPKKNTS